VSLFGLNQKLKPLRPLAVATEVSPLGFHASPQFGPDYTGGSATFSMGTPTTPVGTTVDQPSNQELLDTTAQNLSDRCAQEEAMRAQDEQNTEEVLLLGTLGVSPGSSQG
jgi:hypothetical protein